MLTPGARARLRSAAITAAGLICFLAAFLLPSLATGGEGL